MKIETYDYFNLCSYKKMFFRVSSLSGENGMQITPLGHNCFWAFVDVGDNDFRIIAYPNRGWFEDWIKAQPTKVKVIQEQGIIKVGK